MTARHDSKREDNFFEDPSDGNSYSCGFKTAFRYYFLAELQIHHGHGPAL